jgi:hypothetical protein
VTLRDVAALAGVSASTVSNVVHARVTVREQTRRRVRDAIDQLGYRPNLAARRLRSGRSRVIGPALPSVTVPYFRDLADAVLRGAGEHGLSVLITQTHGDVRRERARNDVIQLGLLLDKFSVVVGEVGRLGRRSDALLADRGYGHGKCRRLLWQCGIRPVIAKRGESQGTGLGGFRYVFRGGPAGGSGPGR